MDAKVGNYFRQLLLEEARSVSQEALDRLKELHDRYPTDLPEELIDELQKVRPDYHFEQRACPRVPSGGRARVWRSDGAEPRDEPDEVVVFDEGRGGVAVLCDRPFPVGAVVRLVLQQGADEVPSRRAEVRHCRRREHGWLLGCQFLPSQPNP